MIIGIGVDLVDVERFKWMIRRTPSLTDRLFTAEERYRNGQPRSAESLAGRFAVKEAVVKALGDAASLRPADCEVVTGASGKPSIRLSNELNEIAESLRITRWHVSISHDGGFATAYVIAEGGG